MNKYILCTFASLCFVQTQAQRVYELSAPAQPKVIKSDHLRMGGVNPKGERIDVNNFYMSIGGKPVIPVMGEFHYSRYPAEQWEEEILKMKAGGVNVVPTYVFWSLHEEVEGQYRWDGQRNLRGFIELCKKHDMPVIVRIGPWCHGEIRSGGFPDWLFAKPLEVRSNDPEYLKIVKRLYTEIGKQLKGLYYKDGGPIIGCQLENEMQHSAAPWAICYPGEPKDHTAASYNAGEVIKAWATEGHSVALPGLGTMRFSLSAKTVADVNDVKTSLITTRRIIFTPATELKDELKKTSVVITCYDRNGEEVKRVTSADEGIVEDGNGSGSTQPDNGGDSTDTTDTTQGGGNNGGGTGTIDTGGSQGSGNTEPTTPTDDGENDGGD